MTGIAYSSLLFPYRPPPSHTQIYYPPKGQSFRSTLIMVGRLGGAGGVGGAEGGGGANVGCREGVVDGWVVCW